MSLTKWRSAWMLFTGTAAFAPPGAAVRAADTLLRDRAGAEAEPTPVPNFALPVEHAPPVSTQPPALSPRSLRISDITVTTEPAGKPPHARPGWTPRPDAATGLRLEYRPGELLDATWVRRQFVVNRMLGRETGYDRVVALLLQINLAYADNGFVNSGILIAQQAPDDRSGHLHLRLIYGHLASPPGNAEGISVTWRDGHARGLTPSYVRHRLGSAAGAPLDVRALESDFRLLADDPAIRTVDSELIAGAEPGEASLSLTVDPQPRYDLYAGFANSRSPSVGGERASVGGLVRNALTAGDVLSGEYGSTEGVSDFTAGYSAPFLSRTLAIRVRGGFDDAAVIARPLVPLDIHSHDWFVEGGLEKTLFAVPLEPGNAPGRWRPAQSASAGLLLVHRRVTATLLGEPFSFSPGAVDGRTEYSAIRLTGDYTRRSPRAVLALALTGTLGIEGTHRIVPGVAVPSERYTALLLQANYARRLDDHGLELRLRFSGQGSGGLLYAPERMAVGGSYTVRGYRESLLLADEGAVGSIELARAFDLARVHSAAGPSWGAFTLAAFVDGALVHNRRAPQPTPTGIASIGGSLDWRPAPWFFARVTLAQALRHVRPTGDSNRQDRGFEFRVVVHPIAAMRALL